MSHIRPTSDANPDASLADSSRQTGDWQLLGRLGMGRWTEVFAARPARSSETPADYAVKMVRDELLDDRLAIAMLRSEARVGRQVHHPNLSPTLTCDFSAPRPYLVQPLLAGSTLEKLLAKAESLSLARILWFARQAAEALAALHESGWVHRDVKPANLIVSPAGHLTLIDLGFAVSFESARRLAGELRCGTYETMAPESFTRHAVVDHRCDLYSLGVVLYQMLTGRLPVEADDPAAWSEAHRLQRPTHVSELAAGLPAEVARLVHALLAKEPLRRPHSARDLARQLLRLEIATLTSHAA